MTRAVPRTSKRHLRTFAVPLLAALTLTAGCASADPPGGRRTVGIPAAQVAAATGGQGAESDQLRLGFFGNVTHATPLVGLQQGFYAEALGDTEIRTSVFGAGPAAVEALRSGSLDAAYLGPNPAINGWVKSDGTLLRIVAGATSGGAALVVQPGIEGPEDLRGKQIATPQLGGTQDVALRAWLAENGLEVPVSGKGDASILNAENASTLEGFKKGDIDAAWLPEPWASRLVLEAGAEVLVDEKELWPEGRFVTTHLVVTQDFLQKYPGTVRKLLEAQVTTNDWISGHATEAKAAVNARLADPSVAGKPLPEEVLDGAWESIEVTTDPLAATLKESAQSAVDAKLLEQPDLAGIYDLSLLNEVLEAAGKPVVDDADLGLEESA